MAKWPVFVYITFQSDRFLEFENIKGYLLDPENYGIFQIRNKKSAAMVYTLACGRGSRFEQL